MRLWIIFGLIYCLLLLIRIGQIGGLDTQYRDPPSEILQVQRQELSERIQSLLPQPQGAILAGILIGDGKKIPFKLKKVLTATSTIHIVVVSGQNLSMLTGMLLTLVYFVGRKKLILFCILAIILYSLLTGMGVPVLRAALMVGLSFLAQLIGRQSSGVWFLCLAALILLIINPNWLFSISFQLSFLATLGIMVIPPLVEEFLSFIPQFVRENLLVTLSAQIFILPVIIYNFGQLSLLGALSNIFILWTVPLIMLFGFFALMLSFISWQLGSWLAVVPSALITYFIYIVHWFSRLPASYFFVGTSPWFLWMGYYLILIALIWFLNLRKKGYTG